MILWKSFFYHTVAQIWQDCSRTHRTPRRPDGQDSIHRRFQKALRMSSNIYAPDDIGRVLRICHRLVSSSQSQYRDWLPLSHSLQIFDTDHCPRHICLLTLSMLSENFFQASLWFAALPTANFSLLLFALTGWHSSIHSADRITDKQANERKT